MEVAFVTFLILFALAIFFVENGENVLQNAEDAPQDEAQSKRKRAARPKGLDVHV